MSDLFGRSERGMFMSKKRRKDKHDGSDREADENRGDTGPGASGGPWTHYFSSNPITSSALTVTTTNTDPGPGLEVEQQEEPIRAWRVATVRLDGRHFVFGAINEALGTFEAESVAVCQRGGLMGGYLISPYYITFGSSFTHAIDESHEAPQQECACGFYALDGLPAVRQLVADRSHVILAVDLYGRVIVHEHGYRAQKQRVLGVTVPADCIFCDDSALPAVPFEGGPLIYVCDEHRPDDHVAISLHTLASKLGTEVRREGRAANSDD